MRETVLFIDDDRDLCRTFLEEIRLDGVRLEACASLKDSQEKLPALLPSVVVLDILMPDGNGLELLPEIKETLPFTEVIILTGHATVRDAIAAMKRGAYDFLTKPCKMEELELIIQRALEKARLVRQATGLSHQLSRRRGGELVIHDPKTQAVFDGARKVAATETTVLITGETGVGKEGLARFIHASSPRTTGLFMVLDCTLLEENFLLTELFGHEQGAFTGASKRKEGLLEIAHGGTLFLDEIGDLDKGLQTKFLRFLETGTFRRLGGVKDIQVSVRTLLATNRDLSRMVREKTFREDLYFRLNIFPLHLPPLRERPGDILPLAVSFCETLGKEGLTREAELKLSEYPWPGNIRELKNIIERACILCPDAVISQEYILLEKPIPPVRPEGSLKTQEQDAILRTLKETDGNRKLAAARLGISERTLYRRLKHSPGEPDDLP